MPILASDALETRPFYEAMQRYRNAAHSDQVAVIAAYDEVKRVALREAARLISERAQNETITVMPGMWFAAGYLRHMTEE